LKKAKRDIKTIALPKEYYIRDYFFDKKYNLIC